MLIHIIAIIFIAVLIYYLALTIWYTTLLVASVPEILRKFKETKYGNILKLLDQDSIIPMTIVTPAFNEEKRILNTLYSILNSNYKNVNMIVVNDGSTDNTMKILKEEFLLVEIPLVIKQSIKTCKILHQYQSKRFPNLTVLDKEHGPYNTSADSLNAGLNACKTPLMLTVDADTVLEPEALTRVLLTFLSKNHSIAVSGSVYVLNENTVENGRITETRLPRHFIPAVQSIEYLRSFLYGRAGLNVFGGSLCYPGAYTLFETEILRKVDGFDVPSYASDAEITIKLHHWMRKNGYPYNMHHTPSSFCWTEVPATVKSFWTQRDKWQRGMLRSAFRHIGMLFNPRYGIVGLLTFPTFIFFEIMGPVIEFLSFILFLICLYFNAVSFTALLWYLFLAWGFVTFISIAVIYLNLISFNKYQKPLDTFKVTALVFGEMFGFRQFRAVCSTMGTVRYIINRIKGAPL